MKRLLIEISLFLGRLGRSICILGMLILVIFATACGHPNCNEDLTSSPAALTGTSASTAQACADFHCYGITRWTGAFTQTHATISVATLTCGAACVGAFVDDEIWLSDTSSNWVEAGYGLFSGKHTYSFWADNRAIPNGGYHEHFLDSASTGTTATYSIASSGTTPQAFDVTAAIGSTCHHEQSTKNGLNTNNDMVDVGLETYDPTASSASPTCKSSGLTASAANFTGVSLSGVPSTPTGPPPKGTLITAGPPISAAWSGMRFTTSCA